MGRAWAHEVPDLTAFTGCVWAGPRPVTQGAVVLDLLYIGLTIAVFAALWLLVKGVERIER